ncbi:MAG: hypothetical protein WAO35_21520 [Terriglobia bacterium]
MKLLTELPRAGVALGVITRPGEPEVTVICREMTSCRKAAIQDWELSGECHSRDWQQTMAGF